MGTAYTPDVARRHGRVTRKMLTIHLAYLSQTSGPLMKTALEQVLPNTKQTKFVSKAFARRCQPLKSSNKKNGISNNILVL